MPMPHLHSNALLSTLNMSSCRSHKKGECAASECSLLCNDFLRLGYNRMVVDPAVRQAYNVEDVRRLYDSKYVSCRFWKESMQELYILSYIESLLDIQFLLHLVKHDFMDCQLLTLH